MSTTYGSAGQPAQSTFNYDALISTSLANYRDTLIDNIGVSNAFFKKLYDSKQWESRDGGLYIVEDLMYGLASVDSYSGYDELPTTPPEGITQAQFQWSQCASPIAISEEERKKNKHRIVDLITARIQQSEIGIKQFFAQAFLQGSFTPGSAGVGSLLTPYQSTLNGSNFVDPIGKIIDFDPTQARAVGGITQSTNTWWKNQTKDINAVTTYDAYLANTLNMYNTCSKGTGGAPDLVLVDQVSWELLALAYYKKYLANMPTDGNFPFANLKFFDAMMVWDEYMVDAKSNVATTATYGTQYWFNTKFWKVVYESETNFVTTDFQKPVNQDVRVKHILWMGGVTVNNRRKQGVMGGVPRSLT